MGYSFGLKELIPSVKEAVKWGWSGTSGGSEQVYWRLDRCVSIFPPSNPDLEF
jgi:hypothetical protein